jgi:hypothetical protein
MPSEVSLVLWAEASETHYTLVAEIDGSAPINLMKWNKEKHLDAQLAREKPGRGRTMIEV